MKNLKCGLVMPISAIDGYTVSHWSEVKEIIVEALAETDFVVELVSVADDVGVIQKRIVQNIYDSDMIICDVSAKNSNVMFELGMRLAFDKPAILIKDDKTAYSFDTQVIEHLPYPADLNYRAIQLFKSGLKEKTEKTYLSSKESSYTTFLKHFGKFVVAKVDETVLGKEDFILESMRDMQVELKLLAQAVRVTRPNGFLRGPSDFVTEKMALNQRDFLFSFMDKNIAKFRKFGSFKNVGHVIDDATDEYLLQPEIAEKISTMSEEEAKRFRDSVFSNLLAMAGSMPIKNN